MALLLFSASFSPTADAEGFSANFKSTDIEEFINTISKNLNKTVIIDPAVKGKITVRSYDQLDRQQYYQFFLSVMEVYGFSVITMDNGFLKIIPSKNTRGSAIPLADNKTPGEGDEVVIRVIPLQNVSARDLAPLLRQLNDAGGVGSVVHYDLSNVLLITGRAVVVNQMLEIIHDVDKATDQTVVTIPLAHASAVEVVKLVTLLNKEEGPQRAYNNLKAKVAADERTNAVLISGEEKARQQVINMIRQLDRGQAAQGNTKVIYLKYAKATSLMEVLTGVGSGLQKQGDSKSAATETAPAVTPAVSLLKNVTIKADEQTNALIITAAPDVMADLEQVINQLDIRRAQVLVEAVIVEVQDADGLNLGVQWFNKYGGGTNFPDSGAGITNMFNPSKDNPHPSFASTVKDVTGVAAGFYHGNWAALFTALASSSKNNILATPSIVTMDNMEAEFTVGQDVPILTGSQPTSGDHIYNSVARKNVGIKLKVKPQINKGDVVLLQIEQEVSSVADTQPAGTKDLGASFNTRTVNNAVMVASGDTVVVGGILDSSTSDVVKKVPLLGDIPGLGILFRSTSSKNIKRNLMLFIRPTIIHSNQDFQKESQRKFDGFDSTPEGAAALKPLQSELDTLQRNKKSRSAFEQVQKNITQFYAKQP